MKQLLLFKSNFSILLCFVAGMSSSVLGQCPVVAPVPNDACYQTVIANDSWCCYNSWDGLCQSAYDGCVPPGPVTPTSGDCGGAIPICTNNSAFAVDPNGYGNVNELCTGCVSNPSVNPASGNSGCLLSGELNSTWFSISVVSAGTLEFSFGAPGGFNCYDWIIWPYTPSACSNIASNNLAPVRCNWNSPCGSFTGVGSVPAGGDAGNFEPVANVVAGQQFLICMSNYSSAYTTVPLAFYGTANIQCTPLSVELQSFSATDMRGYNIVEWSTASEVNCSHFELERSLNGSLFEKIAVIEGNGTTLDHSNYAFEDLSPGPNVTYYRLKQVDFDGQSNTSVIIVVAQEQPELFEIVKVYPNPAEDLVNVHFCVPNDQLTTPTITDLNGRQIYQETRHCEQGSNLAQLLVQDYRKGLYLVTICNEQTQVKDVVTLSVE